MQVFEQTKMIDRRHEQAPAAAVQSNSGTNNVLVCMKAKK